MGTIKLTSTVNHDEIHISLRVDVPPNFLERKIVLDVDANTNDFALNYYCKEKQK